MNWFETFRASMLEGSAGPELVGANGASSARVLAHYRLQHQDKIRDAIELSFPRTKELMGEAWDGLWESFWASKPTSPRSLDFFSEVFFDFALPRIPALAHQEVLRFEWFMEIHPWTHERLKVLPLPELLEDTRLVLAPLDVREFSVVVTELYDGDAPVRVEPQRVLFWMKESGLHFRALADWEEAVLRKLPDGLGVALEAAPEDAAAVATFFQWLGSSGLIRAQKQ